MAELPSQKAHWNQKHARGDHKKFVDQPSKLAKTVLQYLNRQQSILDLGCGVGNDASYFAKKGHQVTAVDFADKVIQQNRDRYTGIANLEFTTLDITQLPLPFKPSSFGCVHAHLSLHYFDNQTTKKLFKEVHRLLKPSGLFSVACKGIRDYYYGKGEEIESNMYLYNGHIRHFFTKKYLEECLENNFSSIFFEELNAQEDGKPKHLILCVARKVQNA